MKSTEVRKFPKLAINACSPGAVFLDLLSQSRLNIGQDACLRQCHSPISGLLWNQFPVAWEWNHVADQRFNVVRHTKYPR